MNQNYYYTNDCADNSYMAPAQANQLLNREQQTFNTANGVWQYNSEATANVLNSIFSNNQQSTNNNNCYNNNNNNNPNSINFNNNLYQNDHQYPNNNANSAIIERFHKRQLQSYKQQQQQQHQQSQQFVQHQSQQDRKFVSLDGNQGGVPTRTTATLTPTTMRNIEQSLYELTNETGIQAPYQAGFVPPPAPFNTFNDTTSNDNNSFLDDSGSESGSQSGWHTPITHEENSMATDTSSLPTSLHGSPGLTSKSNSTSNGGGQRQTSPQNRRHTGGRRPTKASNLSPEEEEKRRVRRERNKAAAARCRKRRVDQTNDLQEKVEKLEKEKDDLQKEIEAFTVQQDELKFILQAHRAHCKRHHSESNDVLNGITNPLRASPIDIKPIIIGEFDEKIIKNEPLDSFDSLDPPSPKRIILSNPLMPQQLPNVSTITSIGTPMLNTPILTKSPPPNDSTTIVQQNALGAIVATTASILTGFNSGITIKSMSNSHSTATAHLPLNSVTVATAGSSSTIKARPNSLNVPLDINPAQAHLNKMIPGCGVAITTPSTGVFNFESLMDGRTGLTPVSGPLMPNSNSRHPLELTMTTPTTEPAKLVSL